MTACYFLTMNNVYASSHTNINSQKTSTNADMANATKPIYLEIDKGKLLYLKDNPTTIFIANPDIADFQLKAPGVL